MGQIDVRQADKSTLFALLVAKNSPENIDLQIAQTKIRMNKEDVEDIVREMDELLELVNAKKNKPQRDDALLRL